jgi:hypothetical protein
MFKELSIPPRDSSVKDESIWSFISRRFDSSVADNLVDPVFKGIYTQFKEESPHTRTSETQNFIFFSIKESVEAI